MAAIFYMPRLFVYHAGVKNGSESDKIFQIMEAKLLKIIMNPAGILTFLTGIALARMKYGGQIGNHWLTVKGFAAVLIAVFHIYLMKIRIIFLNGKNTKSHKFYRFINEIPTILLFIIVAMVIFKPF
ncbi:Putative membrane protein [Candidatus Deianiraea vastatrix]|uniref:Protoporphyrinogen IX oxidase n=2 Tax=Candidatus Deianiraea vastatrix TaxID=2163644 RepID=A0A5B8XDP9_9RICK|nr:Putative membrane protein [Candidatus Deianiraea vastatrix]